MVLGMCKTQWKKTVHSKQYVLSNTQREHMKSKIGALREILFFFSQKLQASLSPQNYSHHMMTSLDILYEEVK